MTISPGAPRTYLLKGLIKCVHCGMPLWAETLGNTHQYYREQRGTRSYGECPARGKSIPAEIVDEQVTRLVESLTLEENWQQYLVTRLMTTDDRARISKERQQLEGRLKRLGRTFVDQLIEEADYQKQVREIRARLDTMVIPEVNEALESGKLVQDLRGLWSLADLDERHRLLRLMMDAVYVDIVTTRKVVGIAPKPGFRRLFEVVCYLSTKSI